MKKIFLIFYMTLLSVVTIAFLVLGSYKDYRFYVTLLIFVVIGEIIYGRIRNLFWCKYQASGGSESMQEFEFDSA